MAEKRTVGDRDIWIADVMFVAGTVMLTSVVFITRLAFHLIAQTVDYSATIEQIARAYEANPAAISVIAGLDGIGSMIRIIFFPGVMLAMYYVLRRRYVPVQPAFVIFLGALIFMFGLMNFANDLGGLLGIMLARGLL